MISEITLFWEEFELTERTRLWSVDLVLPLLVIFVDTTTNEIKRMVYGISNFIIVIDHAR